jgi:hypothetical protein
MHTSFEDLRVKQYNDRTNVPYEGSIGRFVDGELIWERPRSRFEADKRYRHVLIAFGLGAAVTVPFAVALVFILS